MSTFLRCLYGPRLYRIHKSANSQGHHYEPNSMENFGDVIIRWLKFCWGVGYWGSPVILPILYRRGTFTLEGLASLTSYAVGVSIILSFAITVRAIGRYFNKEYIKFLTTLKKAQSNFDTEIKHELCKYDSEVHSWPVDFSWKQGSPRSSEVVDTSSSSRRSVADKIKTLPCHVLSYICAHTFGRRMVYPGTTALIQMLMSPVLMQGRAKLIEDRKGQRAIIETEDGNRIDTMFVDRRNKPGFSNGNILVVCCEGNSGFYEVGCMCTPLETGHSVLGWNHPGFWGSTGVPWPRCEQKAIDSVMQYAINKLGFPAQDIVLFGWSIGGFTVSYAAMCYPEVRHVIVDATFDHILPLATNRMPQSWQNLVKMTIRKYLNLNNAEQLIRYPGPVLLIRRTKDEMISVDPAVIATNRGNDLLIQLLKHRYPKILTAESIAVIRDYLSAGRIKQAEIVCQYSMEEALCGSRFASYVSENSCSYPMLIGDDYDEETKIQMALFLVNKYLVDFDSTHCTPLPAAFFRKPWSP